MKFSTCRKFSGMDFLLVTIPPIGFMGSTAAVNTAAKVREMDARRCLMSRNPGEVEDQGEGEHRIIMIEMWKRWRKRVKI